MTITLDLTPEQEQRLRQVAAAQGPDPVELLHRMLQAALAEKEQEADPPAPRIPGLHAGQIGIGDDFDAPLPDDFWTGPE